MLGEEKADETSQTEANRQLFRRSKIELSFMSSGGAAMNKLPSMGYCKTQIHSAEQPLHSLQKL